MCGMGQTTSVYGYGKTRYSQLQGKHSATKPFALIMMTSKGHKQKTMRIRLTGAP